MVMINRILKSKSKRSLHYAWGTGGSNLPEERIDLRAGGIESGRHVDGVVLRVVKHVICFPSKYKQTLFIDDGEPFSKRHIPIGHSRPTHIEFARIAGIIKAGASESGRVEPLVERAARRSAASDNVHALTISTSSQVRTVRGREIDGLRL